jgi:hypothetical protein
MMELWGPNCTYDFEAGACLPWGDLFGVALAASQREKWLRGSLNALNITTCSRRSRISAMRVKHLFARTWFRFVLAKMQTM